MFRRVSNLVSWMLPVLMMACSGNSADDDPPSPPVAPGPPTDSAREAIEEEIANFPVANMAFIIGDANGRLLTIEKGAFTTSDPYRIASASKWLTGYAIFTLVEAGRMGLADHPQQYLGFWTDDPSDPRSKVTLEQLLSFTSGLNYPPDDDGCLTDPTTTIQACAEDFFRRGIASTPGEVFFYGDAHQQVAAAMVERRLGLDWRTFFTAEIAPRLGLRAVSDYELPSRLHPRVAAGVVSSVDDYERFLRALLTGDAVENPQAFLADRTSGLVFESRVNALEELGLAWHYGLGFWRECDAPSFTAACQEQIVVSSPGGFGTTPWIDFENGYYAMIAMDERIVNGEPASVASVRLEQKLQDLIVDALSELRN